MWPVATGQEIFFFRDVGTTHRPAMTAYHEVGRAWVNPFASFGQPYLGNPNLLISYPFPKGPRWIELRILLHLAICFAGTLLFLRIEGRSMEGAFFGASVFALSGYVLSAASSLNAVTTIAWIPWVFSGVLLLSGPRKLHAAFAMLPLLALFSIAGEPVLIAITVVVAFACLTWRRAWTGLLLFVVAGIIAVLLTYDIHRATWIAASESRRLVVGFSAAHALTASAHPARLLETLVPYLFGNPSRIGPGSFWGYRVSRGAQPYVFSLHVGVVGLIATFIAVLRPRREDRIVIVALALSVLAAAGGFLPGAEEVYARSPWVHFVRFPIKCFLFSTLAIAILAARGFDRVYVESPRASAALVPAGMALSALFMVAAAWVHSNRPRVQSLLASWWWDDHWRSDPRIFLAPIVDGIPPRFAAIAALLAIAAWAAARPTRWRAGILQLACVVDLLLIGRWMLPAIPTATVAAPSTLVQTARQLNGRIYERAAKDLDSALYGISGVYATDDVDQFAVAQHRQAWALSGVRYGLRYAYDRAPDASYTWRNDLAAERIDGAGWPERIAWLRAAGVRGIITSEELSGPSIRAVARETAVGVPVTLYAIERPRPEVRRVVNVLWARTAEAALSLTLEAASQNLDTIVVEAAPRRLSGQGVARTLRDDPDFLQVDCQGSGPAVLFITRSYTKEIRATVNGVPAEAAPANVHLTAIVVPAGMAVVRISFTPSK